MLAIVSIFYIENPLNYQIIETHSELEKVCHAARQKECVMLDTEFVRTRTYYPQLGLIQLYDGELLSLVDVIAIDDLTPLQGLLQDMSVLKVLHACGEDLEVFNHSLGCLPTPMVDTQIMSAFLGNGISTGFAALVEEHLGVALDKSESRTDWCARPLSQKQLDYAAADVFYLLPMYEKLKQLVEDAGWWSAAEQECVLLASKRIKEVNLERAYLDTKGAWQLLPKQLAILQLLAAWRVKEAIKRNLALNFVFKEPDLLEVARNEYTSPKAMEMAGMDIRSVNRHGRALSQIVKQSLQIPADEYPEEIVRLMDRSSYKTVFKKLKDEIKVVSTRSGLKTEFIASKKQLNAWLKYQWKLTDKKPDLMQGWRAELVGDALTKVLESAK